MGTRNNNNAKFYLVKVGLPAASSLQLLRPGHTPWGKRRDDLLLSQEGPASGQLFSTREDLHDRTHPSAPG